MNYFWTKNPSTIPNTKLWIYKNLLYKYLNNK